MYYLPTFTVLPVMALAQSNPPGCVVIVSIYTLLLGKKYMKMFSFPNDTVYWAKTAVLPVMALT